MITDVGEQSRAAVPDLLLERYRLGELPPHETERVAHLLTRDERLRRRIRELERSDGEIERDYSPDRLALDVAARTRHDRPAPLGPRSLCAALLAVPAAAALIAAIVVWRPAWEAGESSE